MESDEGFRQLLRELLAGQKLAVLSTHNGGQPGGVRLIRTFVAPLAAAVVRSHA